MKKYKSFGLFIAFLSLTILIQACNNNGLNNVVDPNCLGNKDCFSQISANFKASDKKILDYKYLGDGKFMINAIDAPTWIAFNSEIRTDCNCAILDQKISIIR